MEKITLYKCEICGKQHETEKDCKRCERSHKSMVSIIHADYHPGEMYPYLIEVKSSEGEAILFRRVFVVDD